MKTKEFKFDEQLFRFNEAEDVKSRIIAYSENLMLMEWTFSRKGTVLPMHNHVHEQLTTVLRGSVEVTMADGTTAVFRSGDAICFASNEDHGLTTLEDDTVCMDVFSPMRKDHLASHVQNRSVD